MTNGAAHEGGYAPVDQGMVAGVKRGPGRPRKHPLPPAQEQGGGGGTDSSADEAPSSMAALGSGAAPAKRKRGRPPKPKPQLDAAVDGDGDVPGEPLLDEANSCARPGCYVHHVCKASFVRAGGEEASCR